MAAGHDTCLPDSKTPGPAVPALPCCLGCSPRQVLHAALERHGPRRARTFLRRLAWRDLAYWALWRFPWMPEQPLRCASQSGRQAGRQVLSQHPLFFNCWASSCHSLCPIC